MRFLVLPVESPAGKAEVMVNPASVDSITPAGSFTFVSVGRGVFRTPLSVHDVLELIGSALAAGDADAELAELTAAGDADQADGT